MQKTLEQAIGLRSEALLTEEILWLPVRRIFFLAILLFNGLFLELHGSTHSQSFVEQNWC